MKDKRLENFVKDFTECAGLDGITDLRFLFEDKKISRAGIYQGYDRTPDITAELEDSLMCKVTGNCMGYTGIVCASDMNRSMYPEYIRMMKDYASVMKAPYVSSISSEDAEACEVSADNTASAGYAADPSEVAADITGFINEIRPDGFDKFVEVQMDCSARLISIFSGGSLTASDIERNSYARAMAVAKRDGDVSTAEASLSAGEPGGIDCRELLETAACEAASLLGAKAAAGGKYPVILGSKVMAEMTSIFLRSFCLDSIRQKTSRIRDCMGLKIAADVVSLREDPEYEGGGRCRRLDDEGTKTSCKSLIDHGTLRAFLSNIEEASSAGISSTGNGFMTDIRRKTGIGVTNLILDGNTPASDLAEMMGDGLLITGSDGLFAGADPVSGDFLFIAKGHYISGGMRAGAAHQITVAGNFFDMLRDIRAIADDHRAYTYAEGCFVVPSVYVGELVISGE